MPRAAVQLEPRPAAGGISSHVSDRSAGGDDAAHPTSRRRHATAWSLRLAVALASIYLANAAQGQNQFAPLEAGFAKADITPPVGHRMSGYFYERFSTGVHNPLNAKAVVLKQGNVRCAWVFCDLVGVPREVSSAARDAVAERIGIPRDHIFVAATHSHTGPLYFGPLRDYFHERALEHAGTDSHEAVDYPQELTEKLVAVIAEAAGRLAPTDIACDVAIEEGLSFNRRYFLKDGSVATNPGKMNPNIARPAGPIDPQVGLLQFKRAGAPVAGLTTFALHLDTTGGTEYAADYSYFLEQELQARFGPGYVSIFGIGACGDINHIDVSHGRPQKSHDEAQRIGKAIAATALTALASPCAIANPQLSAASVVVHVPLQEYSADEIAAARANLTKVGTREIPMLEQVAAVKIVGIDDYGVDKLPMEVQAFKLGDDVALVALPGELFVELGLAIKSRSPFAATLVVELSNDYPGYIPTRRAFAEGGYEPTNSKVAPGGGEQLVDAAVDLLDRLKQEGSPAASVNR